MELENVIIASMDQAAHDGDTDIPGVKAWVGHVDHFHFNIRAGQT